MRDSKDNEQFYKADFGKSNPLLLEQGMPDALEAINTVLDYGAIKYAAHSWKNVKSERYDQALRRHRRSRDKGELMDNESGLLHLAHEACNILFLLQDFLDKNPEYKSQQFKQPPQNHKMEINGVPV